MKIHKKNNSMIMTTKKTMTTIDKKIKDCLLALHKIDINVNQIALYDNDELRCSDSNTLNNEEENQIKEPNKASSYYNTNESRYFNNDDYNDNNSRHFLLSPDINLSPFNENKFKNTLFYQSYPMNRRNHNIKSSSIIKKAQQTGNSKYCNDIELITESTNNTIGGKSKYRLTQSSKSNCQLSKKEESICNDQIYAYNHDYNSTNKTNLITFQAEVNNQSNRLLVSKTSKERLLKKKYHKSQSYISKLSKSPYREKSIGERDKKSDVSSFIQVYSRSKKQIKEKEAKIKMIISQREKSDFQKYSFKPKINQNDRHSNHPRFKSTCSFDDFISKNKDFENKKKHKLNELVRRISVIENQLHSFSPITNKSIKRDDRKLIINQIPFMNDYVNSMRRFRNRSKSIDDSYSSSSVFNVSMRKFTISKEKKPELKEIKDVSYYRSISAKEIIDNRYKYGINDYFDNEEQTKVFPYCDNTQ